MAITLWGQGRGHIYMNLYQKEPNCFYYTDEPIFCSKTKKQVSDGYEIKINNDSVIIGKEYLSETLQNIFWKNKNIEYIEIRGIESSAMPLKKKKKEERAKMTLTLRYSILKRDNFKCVKCGVNASDTILEIDHIIPISKGGISVKENLQTLCFLCNKGKGVLNG